MPAGPPLPAPPIPVLKGRTESQGSAAPKKGKRREGVKALSAPVTQDRQRRWPRAAACSGSVRAARPQAQVLSRSPVAPGEARRSSLPAGAAVAAAREAVGEAAKQGGQPEAAPGQPGREPPPQRRTPCRRRHQPAAFRFRPLPWRRLGPPFRLRAPPLPPCGGLLRVGIVGRSSGTPQGGLGARRRPPGDVLGPRTRRMASQPSAGSLAAVLAFSLPASPRALLSQRPWRARPRCAPARRLPTPAPALAPPLGEHSHGGKCWSLLVSPELRTPAGRSAALAGCRAGSAAVPGRAAFVPPSSAAGSPARPGPRFATPAPGSAPELVCIADQLVHRSLTSQNCSSGVYS